MKTIAFALAVSIYAFTPDVALALQASEGLSRQVIALNTAIKSFRVLVEAEQKNLRDRLNLVEVEQVNIREELARYTYCQNQSPVAIYSPSNALADEKTGCVKFSISGYQVVRKREYLRNKFGLTAACPSGKYVIGGGCNFTGPVFSQASYPLSNTTWYCGSMGRLDEGIIGDAYAICANK